MHRTEIKRCLFLKCESELDENWTLMKMGQPETPSQSDWLQQNLENGSVVGVDPFLCPIAQWNDLKRGLEKSGHRLVRISSP